jgi:hypothetical protein
MDHYTALPSIQNPRLIDLAGSILESCNIDSVIHHSAGNTPPATFFSSWPFVISNNDQLPTSTLMVATHQLTKALQVLSQHKLIEEANSNL